MTDLEIKKIITLSPYHLTSESYRKLFKDSIDCLVSYPYEYGVFVFIPNNYEEDSLPQDILDCVKFAKDNECTWIMFDCDAYTIAELPSYEW